MKFVLWALICATTIPNFLSFFNIAAGGPSHGHTHLLGSDLDWGQGLVQLAAWGREQNLTQPIFLAYHGPVDPTIYGVSWTPLRDANPYETSIPAGVYAISENILSGDPNAWLVERGSGTSRIKVIPFRNYFLNHQPDARCGPIRVYKVTDKPSR